MTKRKAPEEETEIRWRDKQAISDLLLCTVCQDVFTCPTRISCGHSFCEKCIAAWIASCGRNECPTCRTIILPKATHKDLLAQAFLEREEVFCSVRSCNWMGAFGELRRHEAACKAEAAAKADKSDSKKRLLEFQKQFDKLDNILATIYLCSVCMLNSLLSFFLLHLLLHLLHLLLHYYRQLNLLL